MGNGLEDGKMKNIWLQSLFSYTFSVLLNYVTLLLLLIVSRFAFLPPRFPFLLGAHGKLTRYATVLPGKAAIRQVTMRTSCKKPNYTQSELSLNDWSIYLFFFCTLNIIHSFNCNKLIIPLGFLLAILSGRTAALPDVGKCTFMEYYCDATKCQTVFIKTLQKDPNGDCRYRTVVRDAKKLSVIGAGRLRECKISEFVWELRKTGVVKAAIKGAVQLIECAEESFHCTLLAVQLFLNLSPY